MVLRAPEKELTSHITNLDSHRLRVVGDSTIPFPPINQRRRFDHICIFDNSRDQLIFKY